MNYSFQGDEWQCLSAEQKMEKMWNAICAEQRSVEWAPMVGIASNILLEGVNPTFNVVTDSLHDMKGIFGLFHRKKLSHSKGVISRGEFISNGNHDYTGIFKGSKNVLVRLSTATPYDKHLKMVPSVAMKFLRDGIPSANIETMFAVEGQEGFNFFRNNVSNHIPSRSTDTSMDIKLLDTKVREASKWTNMLGLLPLAEFDEKGKKEEKPKFPFRVIFHPTDQVHSLFPDELVTTDLPEQLIQIKPNTVIYTVHTMETPKSQPIMIGDLKIHTAPMRSLWSDQYLFFQHYRMEEDFKIHPEWIGPAEEVIKNESKHKVAENEETLHLLVC